ncbi:MAG: transcription antitermination factor NusB [Planctomycetes bacterium]|nr:transcription antitermination factor NusB [Planctomycetota bacterium]
MPNSRELRKQVIQLLCQFDSGNEDVAKITHSDFDEDEGNTNEPNEQAKKLACKVWKDRIASDAHIEPFTPEWPMHRQPLVDRNILRLARYEIVSGMTPPIVAIDEAIELAGMYSTEKSASFVNGVLDAIFHDKVPKRKDDLQAEEK